MVHLSFLVGQLSCSVARSGVYNCWRHNLGISCLASLVEEEVYQSALQTCAFADIHGEAGTCYLNTQVEVDKVILLCQFPMGQGIVDS